MLYKLHFRLICFPTYFIAMESSSTTILMSDPGLSAINQLKEDIRQVYIVVIVMLTILVLLCFVFIYVLLSIKLYNKSSGIISKNKKHCLCLWRQNHSWKKRKRFNVNCIQETCRRDTLPGDIGEILFSEWFFI